LTSDGQEALSLRRLATEVGTSTTAIYSLFGGKPGLLDAIDQEAWRRFAAHLDSVRTTYDPVADLMELSRAYRASARADPRYYQIMFAADHQHPVGHHVDDNPRTRGTFELLLRNVQRCMTTSSWRTDDSLLVATALWSAVHGTVSLEINGLLKERIKDVDLFFDEVVSSALEGWRA